MKFSVFTVCMPSSTPAEAAASVRAWGGHGMEWRVTYDTGDTARPGFWSGNRCTLQMDWPEARFAEIAACTRDAGLLVPNLGTYLSAADLSQVERMMHVACLFGAPSLRVGGCGYGGSEPYAAVLERFLVQFGKVVELARQYRLRVLLETHHGTIVPSASAMWRVVSHFATEQVGVIYDPANMSYEGRENVQMALEIIGPYLALVHAKNAKHVVRELPGPQRRTYDAVMSPLRDGEVEWAQVFKLLRRAGYDGWVSVEDFSVERPEDERLRDDLAFLHEL